MRKSTYQDSGVKYIDTAWPFTRAGQAETNSLTDFGLDLVDQVADKYRELMPIGYTGCQYWMSCPSGVNIPSRFEIYNTGHKLRLRHQS